MDSGLYAAYSGLKTNSDILEILSNNLANINTAGFKSDQAFLNIYNNAVEGNEISLDRVLNDSSVVQGTSINFLPGAIKTTGRDLDLALEGDGFFVVQGPAGALFSRNGNFRLDADGRLVNSEGHAVLGQNGPIQLSEGIVSVSKDGAVHLNDSEVDTLQIVDFPQLRGLEKVGNSMFRFRGGETVQPSPSNAAVLQGSLEQSNVNPIREMMLMITVMRQFEGLQKAINTLMNTVNGRSINDVGRVAG
jgi:flagellar basal-body rod protein FlgG